MAELVVSASLAAGIQAFGDTYAEAHDASEGTPYLDDGGNFKVLSSFKEGHPPYSFDEGRVDRGCLSFDTSPLGITASITSVALSLLDRSIGIVVSVETDVGHATLHVVEGVHGDIVLPTDFGELKEKTESGGSIDFDHWIPNDWNTITLNAIGRGWINKTGKTKFGLRLAGDIDNHIPTGENYLYMAGSKLPYLTIVYTLAPAVVVPTVTTKVATGVI